MFEFELGMKELAASKLGLPVGASALTLGAVEVVPLPSKLVGAVEVSIIEMVRSAEMLAASKFAEFKFAAPIPLGDSPSRGWSIMSEYSRSKNDAKMQKTEATTMTAAAAAAMFIGFTILNMQNFLFCSIFVFRKFAGFIFKILLFGG
jgi:hypothetical protein